MTDRKLLLKVLDATTPEEIKKAVKATGMPYMFWQSRHPDEVVLWDHSPPGFFEAYYGSNADRYCPAAETFRQRRWRVFTLNQAYQEYPELNEREREARQIWDAFGLYDGIFIDSGDYGLDSFAVFCGSRDAGRILKKHKHLFLVAVSRLDEMLAGSEKLLRFKRSFPRLAPQEEKAIKVHLTYPDKTLGEQARIVGVAKDTLKRIHERVAKRMGTGTFAGATVHAMRSGLYEIAKEAGSSTRLEDLSPASRSQPITLQGRSAEEIAIDFVEAYGPSAVRKIELRRLLEERRQEQENLKQAMEIAQFLIERTGMARMLS